MRLTFLGTSSGTPTRQRNVSGAALRRDDGSVWIIDCGEGTQHQLLVTDLRPGRIGVILLTHLHGDHCYGLPGLLASIAVHDRGREPVHLIGPRGTAEWVAVTRKVSRLGLAYPLEIHEVPPDGGAIGCFDGCTVTALPLPHRIACFGYLIKEADRDGRFDAGRAEALGVAGPDRGRLVRGETITTADGRQVSPADVVGPARPGRRLALLGDTSDATGIADACFGCDLAVHECTYDASRDEQAAEWGHSTTVMAAAFAQRAAPRQLVLNHFSSRYTVDENDHDIGVADLVTEVRDRLITPTRVLAADDLLHLPVPWPDQDLGPLPSGWIGTD